MILKKFLATFASNNWQIIFSKVSLESIVLQTHKETLSTTLITWLLLATIRNAIANYIKACRTFYKYKPTQSTHLASLQNITISKSLHTWGLGLANSINSSFMSLPKSTAEYQATKSNYRLVNNITPQ
jgi:hypothetical protein